jgi:hypothetical protein
MILLALLLAVDAILHIVVIARFGTGDNNMPFLIFAIVDIVLAILVFFLVPYAVWATLILSAIGLIGLTVTFNKPQREKTLDKVIWVVDAVIVLYSIYLLFAGSTPAA